MGQDRRQFHVVALGGGRGGRGHQACLPNSVTQIERFGWNWRNEQAGGGEKQEEGGEKGGLKEKVA